MKSKKIEIEIVSPDLTDEMIKNIVDSIKSAIQEKHITDNLAFDIVVKENVGNNHPIFPQYPYKEIDTYPPKDINPYSPKKDIYPGYTHNPIMCSTDKTFLNTNHSLYHEEGGLVSDYATEKAKLEKAIKND
jgi:hypothetical protein